MVKSLQRGNQSMLEEQKMERGETRKMGMTARYALGVILHSKLGQRAEVNWLTNTDGSHPTRDEAIEWLKTLDPEFDIVNGRQLAVKPY